MTLTVDDGVDVVFTDWSGIRNCICFESAGTDIFICRCCNCSLKNDCPLDEVGE